MADMNQWQNRINDIIQQEQNNQENSGGTPTNIVPQNNPNILPNTANQINNYRPPVTPGQQPGQTPATPGQTPASGQQPASNAVYSGLPTALGGTWGKTPATLAEEVFAGGQINYTVQGSDGNVRAATAEEAASLTKQAIASLTPQQQGQFRIVLSQLENAPGSTPAEKLANLQLASQDISRDLPVSQRTIESMVQAINTRQAADQPKVVTISTAASAGQPDSMMQLKSGEYIKKEAFDKLPQEYQDILQKDGIDALNERLDKEEAKATAAKAQAIQETQARIADIESRQANYEAQALWDKVAQTLGTQASFEEIVQEALTFGGAKTKAFDSDAIDKEYQETRLKALKEGADLAVSREEYRQQVLSKQVTAQELGMQMVPFEYARPGRWDELQLWEKVVYPALDIVSLVPVVGWAGKGVAAASKGVSIGARIAALGGKEAVEFAAKDAALAVEKAAAQKMVKEGLLVATKEAAQKTADKVEKSILTKAVKAAQKDLKVATKEYDQIVKSAGDLDKMAQAAVKSEGAAVKGAGTYRAAARAEETVGKVGKYTEPLDALGGTGVVGYSTIANWNDLTPEQRTAGLGLAALSSGIVGKAGNLVENVVDPYKIPIAALKPRAARTKAVEGKIFGAESAKGIKGTTRLVLDHTMAPEDARMTVADLQRQLTEGKRNAEAVLKTTEGEKTVRVKGTGFQSVVGKTSISATPMGEIFKEGTGAAGAKSNLEKYLQQANTRHGTSIEIEGRPVKIGETEMTVKTISTPGVTVKGSEGGSYLGASFYNQFAHKAAFGAGGKISSGLLVGTPGISELPKGLRTAKDIATMEKKALKEFDGTKNINKEVEGFKQYSKFMEFENVITNGSQLERAQNLRSKLADTLHMNRAEYYTRDPKGRVELFQMYMEGGRTTPYTMKELYALKGNALRNSLEDMFFGLEKTIEDLKEGKLVSHKENVITKEEQVAKAFNNVDEAIARKGLTEAEGKRLKNEILAEYRARVELPPSRQVLRQEIARMAARDEKQRRADADRERVYVDRVRADRAEERQRAITREVPRSMSRADERPADRTAAREPVRESPRQPVRESPRADGREAPREGSRTVQRETPRTAPREALREVPRETPRETPRSDARGTPGTVPEVPDRVVRFIQEHSEHKELTAKQLEGALAWKQGAFYQLRWQPFGKEDVFYSREPIPGVKYHDGIGSAAKSAVALYGEVPQNVRLDMGIVDVNITRSTTGANKPVLNFKGDPKQKTNYSGNKPSEGVRKGK